MATKYWIGNGGTVGDYSVAANWSASGVPSAGDDVRIIGAIAISAGLDQSAVEIASFITEGHSQQTGFRYTFLQIDIADGGRFEFDSTGKAYIDLGGAAVDPIIKRTQSDTNTGGLLIKGTALGTVDILGPSASVALIDCTATVVNVHAGCTLIIDEGSIVTTVNNVGGTVKNEGQITNLYNRSGAATLNGGGSAAITLIHVTGGTVTSNTTRITTTATSEGGTLDYSKVRTSRNVGTLNYNGGTVLGRHNIVVTTENFNAPVKWSDG